MPPGTEADWFPDGAGYRYLHAGDCEVANKDAEANARSVRFRPTIVIRECSRFECSYATGVGFRGQAPSRCPLCQSPWLADDEWLEAAA